MNKNLLKHGVAGAAALAAGTNAYGNVIVVATPADFVIAPGTATTSVNWDVNSDGITDFIFNYRYPNSTLPSGVIWQANMNPATGTALTNQPLGYQGAFVRYAQAFAAGTVFGATPPANPPGSSFGTAAQVTLGSRYRSAGTLNYYGGFAVTVAPGTPAYAGFRFNVAGQTFYGYIQLSVGPGSIDFISAAYENTPNTNIVAGAVPEPGTLAGLAVGAAGLLGYGIRRRRA